MAQDPSRTETATQKRRGKAREDGNVPRSQELSKATVVLGGLIGLWVYMKYMGNDLMEIFQWFFLYSTEFEASKQNVAHLMFLSAARMAKMILPVVLFVGLVAYVTVRLQVGSLWTTKVFEPKLDKILNPFAGLQKMLVDVNTLIRLGKSMLQAAAIGIAPYIVIKTEWANIVPLFYQNAHGLSAYILATGAKMVIYALIPMLLIAAADLWYTRWSYEENLKMTKDEIKDERKQAEGDPRIKQQQKQKMMRFMLRRMLKDVKKADVVITNPTHIAVALRYHALEAPAPVVLAKGLDHLAEKIKEAARENHVPIRENKPLAQALYKSVEIGEMIPAELFQAVASILAQLSKFKRRQF